MAGALKFEDQFRLKREYFLNQLDFLNWYRYFFLMKQVINFAPDDVLEVGTGSGILKSCLQPLVKRYTVLDINPALEPDILGDVRTHLAEFCERFDCVIIADVLEHIPFADVPQSLANIYAYLKPRGKALITIPHRRSHFLFMTPAQKPRVVTVPTGFLSPGGFYRRFIKRRIWIDPHHCWEIGDGKIRRRDVDGVCREVGFAIERVMKLLYVDFWVLTKSSPPTGEIPGV